MGNRPITSFFQFVVLSAVMVLLASSPCKAQDNPEGKQISNYHLVNISPKFAEYQFTDLEDRKITFQPELKFISTEDFKLEFDITVAPSGKVIYVKPHACPASLNEFRKGGINALYSFRFAGIPPETGDKKYNAVVHFVGPSEKEKEVNSIGN